jgi:hypothetical protein
MTTYDAVGIAEGFVEAGSEDQVIEAWQYIYDNKLYLSLQGWFGRTVSELLKQGIIKE